MPDGYKDGLDGNKPLDAFTDIFRSEEYMHDKKQGYRDYQKHQALADEIDRRINPNSTHSTYSDFAASLDDVFSSQFVANAIVILFGSLICGLLVYYVLPFFIEPLSQDLSLMDAGAAFSVFLVVSLLFDVGPGGRIIAFILSLIIVGAINYFGLIEPEISHFKVTILIFWQNVVHGFLLYSFSDFNSY